MAVDRREGAGETPVALAAAVEEERPGRARGLLLLCAGWASTGLALAGVVLPILPTTPFLLLAGACFLRVSPRLHRRLLSDPRLGPYLEHWQRDRSVPRRAKRRACLLIVATFSISIALAGSAWAQLLLLAVLCALITFLAGLRESAEESPGESRDPPRGDA